MARKADEWMPVHIGDYLADTTHLTRDQHGAYLLLLFAYWRKRGPLVSDDARLAASAKASPAEWRRLRPVMVEFFADDGEFWHHKRADREIERANKLTEAKASAGRRGADISWKNKGKHMAQPSFCHAVSDAPLPSTKPTSEVEVGRFCHPEFDDFWKAYPTNKIMSRPAAATEWAKLDAKDRRAACAAIPDFKAFCATDRTYRPVHACRFLAERRFEGFAGETVDPAKAAGDADRADRLLRRGKYRDAS